MKKIKYIGAAGGQKLWIINNKAIAHCGDCDLFLSGCILGAGSNHNASASKSQLLKLLAGKSQTLDGFDVKYPDKKTVKIGCTLVPRKIIERIAKLLD